MAPALFSLEFILKGCVVTENFLVCLFRIFLDPPMNKVHKAQLASVLPENLNESCNR